MKDRLDSIRRAMHLRTPPAHRTVPASATSSEPQLKTNYDPEPERPDLQFSSLEQDTVLHCQDDSVTAPSLLLALLAPWLGQLLQPGRGQQDSTRNILCPDLRADNIRSFLAEIAAMKDEINVGEDIRSLFLLNFTLGRKETSLEGDNEFDIKELPANEDDNVTPVELKTNSEETKTDPFKNRKSKNKYEAKLLAKFEKVCKCELGALTDAQKVKHFKVTHDVYEKCHKCHQLYIKLFDEIHVCKSPKKKAKQTNTTECTVCGKKNPFYGISFNNPSNMS